MPKPIKLKIRYTSKSLDHASCIKKYLKKNFTQKEIDGFYLLLSSFEEAISLFPKLYPQTKKQSNIRRAVLSKVLCAFYRVTKTDIEIIAILDNRCNMADML